MLTVSTFFLNEKSFSLQQAFFPRQMINCQPLLEIHELFLGLGQQCFALAMALAVASSSPSKKT